MRRSLLRLRPLVGKHKVPLLTGIVAFGVARVFELSIPFFMAEAINRLTQGNYAVGMFVVGIVVAVIARYLTVTFARFQVRKSGLNVSFDLRQQLYGALQDQGAEFFSQHTIGDMMTRAVADISLIQRLISMGTILVVILVYASVFGFAMMLYYSPLLTLFLLPPMPFIFWYARRASRAMGIASRDVQDRLSDLGAHVQENLSGIRTIQAMVQEENEVRRFGVTNQAYADAFYEQGRINSAMSAVMPLLAGICALTILGFGSHLVLQGEMMVGDLVAFFYVVNIVVQPFRVTGFIVNLFQRAAVASDRLFEVINKAPEIPDAPTGSAPEYISGAISLNDLTYAYPGQTQPVLNHLNLDIAPGETVAIMGRVGSGKTTLLKLLIRLLEPQPGQVRIDGHDAADYPLSQLRSQLAFVPQDPFLFGEPLKDNLTYDDPNRALDLIWDAATSADLKNTIEEFPDQLDTLVGERGVTLSGGQKQRATLARGLIAHAGVRGRRVFLRADLNVPMQDGEVTDDTRVRASIPTLRRLLAAGARVALASHLGRPKGERRPEMSLQPVAEVVARHLGRPVAFCEDCVGEPAEAAVAGLQDGEVVLLENLRFHAGETKNDADFAAGLAALADVYVNDAFGTAHRAHASTAGMVPLVDEAAAGDLLRAELDNLRVVLEPERPLLCLLGGAKVSDKLGVLEALAPRADVLAVGGAMAYTFLAARGEAVGASLVEPDRLEDARRVADAAEKAGNRLLLPSDHVVAQEVAAGAASRTVAQIPDGWMGVDIGPETAARYADEARAAATILWNGPMGVFEIDVFAHGTETVAKGVAASSGRSVVGGGDSLAAINKLGLGDAIGHLSTGGGASLEFVQGLELPGVKALER